MHPQRREAAVCDPPELRELVGVERFQPVQCSDYADDDDDDDTEAEDPHHQHYNPRRLHHLSGRSLNQDEEVHLGAQEDPDSLNDSPAPSTSGSPRAFFRHSASDLGYLPTSAEFAKPLYKNRSRPRYAIRTPPTAASASCSPETENPLAGGRAIRSGYSRARTKPRRIRGPLLNRSLSTSSVFALYATRYAREKFHLALRTFKTWYHEQLTYHHLARRMEFNQQQFEQWYVGKGQPLSLRALDRFDQIVIWIAGKYWSAFFWGHSEIFCNNRKQNGASAR